MSLSGILVIDKPEGMTSHDVVRRVRKLLATHRVGHLGTLDPMATGVLPLCIGKATRIGRFFASSPKEYVGEIRLGFTTDTYDREGTSTSPGQPVLKTEDEIRQEMHGLTGNLEQTPPAFSAKKWGGVPSYKFARQGRPVDNVPVPVNVREFTMTAFRTPLLEFRVVCSGGTYVRSLAHDLGQRVGCGAHLESLRRLKSGDFTIEQSVALDRAGRSDVISIDSLLAAWPRIEVSHVAEDRVRHGNPINADVAPGFVRIFNKEGEFLAVALAESGWARPQVVLTSKASIRQGDAF